MAAALINTALTGAFQASKFVLLAANTLTLDFDITVTGGTPATIQWYMEFASSPLGPWRREVAEEDMAGGTVLMPIVVRTFAVNGGTQLTAPGTYNLSTQFTRQEAMARVQIRITAGAATATVTCPSGTQPAMP